MKWRSMVSSRFAACNVMFVAFSAGAGNASSQTYPEPPIAFQYYTPLVWDNAAASQDYFCSADGCTRKSGDVSVHLDTVRITHKNRAMNYRNENLISSVLLPDLHGDFNRIVHSPRVTRKGVQADCIDFSHAGVFGTSGWGQNWTAVVLVLSQGNKNSAYRMDGYRAYCKQLMEDKKGNFLLPLIEMSAHADGKLDQTPKLTWTSCSLIACKKTLDRRELAYDENQARYIVSKDNLKAIEKK